MKMNTHQLTLSALMLALLMVCSQISIPMVPVPITLQTLAVLLIGMLLTPTQALIVTGTYLLLGTIGLPVFAGFKGGIDSILLPPYGFAISFIPASWFIANRMQKNQKTWQNYLKFGLIATGMIYLIGVPYMGIILNVVMNLNKSIVDILMLGFIPFLVGDAIKLAIACTLCERLEPRLKIHVA